MGKYVNIIFKLFLPVFINEILDNKFYLLICLKYCPLFRVSDLKIVTDSIVYFLCIIPVQTGCYESVFDMFYDQLKLFNKNKLDLYILLLSGFIHFFFKSKRSE